MKKKLWIITMLFSGFMLPSISSGSVITIDGSTSGQSATLQENNPDSNADASNLIDIRRRNIAGTERNNVGVFQFDVSSVSQTATNTILKFAFYKDMSVSSEIHVYGLKNDVAKGGVTEANWNQDIVTYNTMPGMNNSDGDCQTSEIIASDTIYLGSISLSGTEKTGDQVAFSTADLTGFVNDDSNESVTFLLEIRNVGADRDEDIQFISSQRSSSGSGIYPTLEVSTVPEPATAGLLLFSGCVALLIRRILH